MKKNIRTGSLLDITFTCNYEESEKALTEFKKIQDVIHEKFSIKPNPPILSSFAVTQTTLVLTWEPLNMYPVELLKIAVYKDGAEIMSNLNLALNHVKITGLAMGTTYDFRIVIYTSAGVYESNKVSTTTLIMEDLSGLNVCLGLLEENEVEELKSIIPSISASYSDNISIATTHLVTSNPSGNLYDEAVALEIPIVTPGFIKACALKKRIQPASSFTPSQTNQNKQSPSISNQKENIAEKA